MGILANVYRNATFGDASNDGVSSRYDTVCVVNVPGPFDPEPGHPPFLLIGHPTMKGIVRAVPAYKTARAGEWLPVPLHHSFGGNFLYSSDGRFSRKAEEITGNPFYGAVSIHDRLE